MEGMLFGVAGGDEGDVIFHVAGWASARLAPTQLDHFHVRKPVFFDAGNE